MKRDKPILAVVIPCYNEEQMIEKTLDVLYQKIKTMIEKQIINENSFLCFIDDGSKDNTWKILQNKLASPPPTVRITAIKLSKNCGHQNALLAGLMSVKDTCDCVISIDGDLQQDEEKFDDFVDRFNKGFDIVLGVRTDRKSDNFFKKITANLFYFVMSLMGTKVIKNHADYRLLSQRVLQELANFKEANLFLRGIVLELGFKMDIIYFDVRDRAAGNSKYSLTKMLSLAWSGITSFSIYPLRIVTFVGCFCLFFAILLSIYAIYVVSFTDNAVPGWASTTIPISFFGGIQIFSIGILGEYIGKIYREVKNRPKYIIEEIL